MKIEKISDNQIRFVLTQEDLSARQIKIGELAYGTEKAKELFRDMMQQAALQYGFTAENIPLMIEAIPLSGESIVLIVTKVENPEELDTRFASFAPQVEDRPSQALPPSQGPSPFEQLLSSLKAQYAPYRDDARAKAQNAGSEDIQRIRSFMMTHRMFEFQSMSDLLSMAQVTGSSFTGESTLVYHEKSGTYLLFLTMKDIEEVNAMQGVIAALSEFGTSKPLTGPRRQYLLGHSRVIFAQDAIGHLAARE